MLGLGFLGSQKPQARGAWEWGSPRFGCGLVAGLTAGTGGAQGVEPAGLKDLGPRFQRPSSEM